MGLPDVDIAYPQNDIGLQSWVDAQIAVEQVHSVKRVGA